MAAAAILAASTQALDEANSAGVRGEPSLESGSKGWDGELARLQEQIVATRVGIEIRAAQTKGRIRTARAETGAGEVRTQLRASQEQVQRLQWGGGPAGPTSEQIARPRPGAVWIVCWETFTET